VIVVTHISVKRKAPFKLHKNHGLSSTVAVEGFLLYTTSDPLAVEVKSKQTQFVDAVSSDPCSTEIKGSVP
jgi:hypothetical protein